MESSYFFKMYIENAYRTSFILITRNCFSCTSRSGWCWLWWCTRYFVVIIYKNFWRPSSSACDHDIIPVE